MTDTTPAGEPEGGGPIPAAAAAADARPSADPAPTADTRPAARRPRIHHGELISAGSALALLVLMFLTKWYGVAGVPDPSAARPAITTAVNAWNSLSVVRWVMLITIGAALGSVVLRTSQRTHGTKTDTSRLRAALGAVTFALLVDRVLIDLPGSSQVIDQKLGAVLGLLCAGGIALGGYESMRERQTLARRAKRRSRPPDPLASGERAR